MLDCFIRRQTRVQRTALVPELVLHLAADTAAIFETAATELPEATRLPLWAFAWPGGQSLARHVLDDPGAVRRRTVVDIGAGSGIAAIAAAKAGARHVISADVDPVAAEAIRMNAALNGVTVEVITDDVLGDPPPADLYLVADLVYDPELATRVAAFLEAARRSGAEVLLADRTYARRPPGPFELIATFDAPLTPPIAELPFDEARLWRLVSHSAATGHHTRNTSRRVISAPSRAKAQKPGP